jgi:hypothetical protein
VLLGSHLPSGRWCFTDGERLGEFGSGASLDEERYEVTHSAVLEIVNELAPQQ